MSACSVSGNSAGRGGGIAFGTAVNSLLSGNQALSSGGGAYASEMSDCILGYNLASNGGGAGAGTLNNCTLVANTATVAGGGAFSATLNNCIIQYNSCTASSNYTQCHLNYCCTTPLPSSGWGNISNYPAFVNLGGADFHLQPTSPCINSGDNSYVTTPADFDGAARIAGGTVDIGAYEAQFPSSVISYAWLQQYGLPTDGSADYVDSDRDGMNNWMEWQAGTDPTNPKSVLRIVVAHAGRPGVTVTWQSVTNRSYFLQRAVALCESAPFQTVATGIAGQAISTSWRDTNAAGAGPFFYRVGVQ